MIKRIAIAAAVVVGLLASASAQTTVPGQPIVPLGYCQLSASQLGSAVAVSQCVRASFTASAGSSSNLLVVTSVTGVIKVGDALLSGTGITAGTTVLNQVSGTTGGAGTYTISAANTASSAGATSGGIPADAQGRPATMAWLQAETADVRYRDDGAAPTAAIGNLVVHGIPGIFYAGTLSQLQFIAVSGSPLLNIAFYR